MERFAGLRSNPEAARYLARAFVAGEPQVDALAALGAETLGREWRWLRPLASRYVERFAGKTRPRLRDVLDFLSGDERFQDACRRHHRKLRVVQRIAGAAPMLPIAAAVRWGVPGIATVAELAAWLRLGPEELAWFADLKGLGRNARIPDQLRHYRYRLFAKPGGGLRLIEAPKERMKTLQRQILSGILERIPAH